MYNEELKKKFIRFYTTNPNTEKNCRGIFNAFEKYEEEWCGDLCTKTAEELQPVVDELIGMRSRSRWVRMVVLKEYVRWCIGTCVPGACDGMLKLNPTGLEKIRSMMVANPKHMQRYLNSICAPESEQTIDDIFRCYYWLAYGGAEEEEILGIECGDVDFENMVIRGRNIDIPLYREAIPAFKNCVNLKQFVYKHANYTSQHIDRVGGNILIRGIRTLPSSVNTMRAELSRKTRKKTDESSVNIRLSYYRAWISGLFYRMYESEKAGAPVDFSNAANQFIQTRRSKGKSEYKLDSGRNTLEAKGRQIQRDYTEDYNRWKLAFFLD